MVSQDHLDGFTPYPPEIIEEYLKNGWWADQTIGARLDSFTELHPDKIAVIDQDVSRTFSQLQEDIRKFSLSLIGIGIQKHDRVLLQLPNRYEFLIAYLGVQNIGAVPVLVITALGRLELSRIAEETQPAAWIIADRDAKRDYHRLTQEVTSELNLPLKIIMIQSKDTRLSPKETPDVFSFWEMIGDANVSSDSLALLTQRRPDPNDVAHILITGGTTGQYKAVPRTHNSYFSSADSANSNYDATDIFLLSTPVGHSMALDGAIGGLLCRGGTLVIASRPKSADILRAIDQKKVTVLYLVPTQYTAILTDPDLPKYDLRSLRFFGTYGAELNPNLAQSAHEFCASVGCTFLWGGYGSSEGPCTKHDPDEPEEIALLSVGRSEIPGNRWIVLGPDEQELPPNGIGELAAKGPSVFTGYYKTENVQALFTKDGYYKTGDLGKISEDGYIYIVGRKKEIIQRGGESVVPQDIEMLLRSHPAIEEVAVVGIPDAYLGERACACVLLKQGETFRFEEMTGFLKEKGAGVLLWPERLEIVSDLPLTDIGKIDKKTLKSRIVQQQL
jgi:non-ribosomal peptide synthetase component E (peptide arylation enzyme)